MASSALQHVSTPRSEPIGSKYSLSMYVHLPWCVRKCPYCDFNSHADTPREDEYLQSVYNELEQRASWVTGRPLQSIYFGGGTPNLLTPRFYHNFLNRVGQLYDLAEQTEITMEANPGEGRLHDFLGYKQSGINRLSIGVQSFHDSSLHHLKRDYNTQQLQHCLDQAFTSGINNINLDLMFALPEQSIDMAIADAQQALTYKPQHLSVYELTLEPNTLFHQHPPKGLPQGDDKSLYYDQLSQQLVDAGFQQYEVSAFARPQYQSIHNSNYWRFGDYLAIGAGAHGKITRHSPMQIIRYNNIKRPNGYMQAIDPTAHRHQLSQEDILQEWCINAFRLKRGVSLGDACTHTGVSKDDLYTFLAPVQQHLVQSDTHIQLTDHAFVRQNYLLQQLLYA